jgi:hypothetical protein
MILRKLSRLLLAGLLGAGLLAGTATAAQADPPTSPDWNEIVAAFITPSHPPCMDLPGGSKSDGVIMEIWSCHGHDPNGFNQRFFFETVPNTAPIQYRIHVVDSGLCLTLSDGATAGFKVFQSGCTRLNSKWDFLPYSFDPNHLTAIQNVGTGLCMTVGDTTGNNGTLIFAEPCGNPVGIGGLGSQQIWSIE